MQTINLEFKELTELPVPTSLAETLYEKTETGQIYQSQVLYDPIDGYYFDLPHILHCNTYAHVKVTAAETPQFKVGDIVKVNYPGYHNLAVVKGFVDGMVTIAYASNFEENVPLTDLTLITNETT